VANCLEMHGTECDNFAYNSSNFVLLASLADYLWTLLSKPYLKKGRGWKI